MNLKQTPLYYSTWKIFGILFLTALVLYGVVLPTPFKSLDDYVCILHNPDVQSLKSLPTVFMKSFFGEGAYYRPMVMVSFVLEYHFFKLNSLFYNLNNVLLHVFNALGVFWMVTLLMNNRKTAFYVAFLFLIHPVHWEAVDNVPGRSILLSAFFMIYAFLAFVRALDKRNLFLYGISIILFAASLLSKETGIVLVGMLGVYIYLFQNPKGKLWTSRYLALIPYFLFIGLYFWIRSELNIFQYFHWDSRAQQLLGVGSFLYACFHYLQALVVPMDFYFDHSSPLFHSFMDIRFWLGVLFWTALGCVLFVKRHTLGRVYSFFIIWVIFNFAPMAQLIPIRAPRYNISTPDHFLYLSSIGFLVLFVAVIQMYAHRLIRKGIIEKQMWRIIVLLYFSYFVVVCFSQNIAATNMFAMYTKALKHNEYNDRVRMSMAVAYALTRRMEEAQMHFNKILTDDPNHPKARVGLAATYIEQGKYWEAILEYDKVTNLSGVENIHKSGRAEALRKLVEQYKNDLKMNPQDLKAMYRLGVLYAKANKFKKAKEYLQNVLNIQANHEQALFNMGSVLSLQGDYKKATGYYEAVIRNPAAVEDDHDQQAYAYLGQIYRHWGDHQKAEEYFEKSRELGIMEAR